MIRILLVDDHILFRSGVKALFDRHGHNQADGEELVIVGEACDGLEGVKLADTVAADVMLLDMDLPSMSGREVLEQVRETHPHLQVLMLTVSEDLNVMYECLLAGACGYLNKTINKDFLVRAVRSAAAGYSVISPEMINRFLTHFGNSFANNYRPIVTSSGVIRPWMVGDKTAETAKAAEIAPVRNIVSPLQPPAPHRTIIQPDFRDEGTPSTFVSVVDPSVLTRRERQALAWIARGLSNKEVARGLNLAESTVKVHVQSILRKLNLTSRVQAAVYAIEHGIDKEEPNA